MAGPRKRAGIDPSSLPGLGQVGDDLGHGGEFDFTAVPNAEVENAEVDDPEVEGPEVEAFDVEENAERRADMLDHHQALGEMLGDPSSLFGLHQHTARAIANMDFVPESEEDEELVDLYRSLLMMLDAQARRLLDENGEACVGLGNDEAASELRWNALNAENPDASTLVQDANGAPGASAVMRLAAQRALADLGRFVGSMGDFVAQTAFQTGQAERDGGSFAGTFAKALRDRAAAKV